MKPGRALATLFLFAVAVLPASCAAVIGLEADPIDAVKEICKCIDAAYPGEQSNCRETLADRLTSATEATRADWIRRFSEERCATCNNAWKCFQEAPTCSSLPCASPLQCCSSNGKKATCDAAHACK